MKGIVIIPAYNEEKSIVETVRDITEHAPNFDYVVVNDCSTDDTRIVCEKNGLHVLNLPVNLGIGGAVQTGYRYAMGNGYEYAVQFDGDGQHDAKYLNDMLSYMEEHGTDMLIGSRYIEKEGFQSTGLRRFGIRYFSVLIKILTGKKITDPTSGMRMVNRDVMFIYAADYPKDYPEPESAVAILNQGKVIEEYPVIMRERREGVSSISPMRSVYYMVKVTLAILVEMLRK
ncbi:MAG: glycosyltransferase family 2 protein [Lachnospiraceae bacterium]|nr:glycosyltransferase family 2 protein [Lachnospiraceae bacterium]